MRRLTGEGEAVVRLDAILHEELADLRTAREAEDARIEAYVGALAEADLARTVRYRTISNPTDVEQPLGPLLLHVFNHQTHHRGQVHGMLTQTEVPPPVLDLHRVIRP
jgi:uncharacterized damage-inducible protein DinB